ncbi:MAG TPA: hypothetical protein VJ861_01590 [Treponemataceae bacterium]|nr:hypothetical protein [Treponemataceae bacterium]
MLHNIVFQDNIYQLARTIDLIKEGLMLDITKDYFFDKTVDDLLFIDATLIKIMEQLESNPKITGYVQIVHSLHSCQERYIQLLDFILKNKCAMQENFTPLLAKLQSIRNTQSNQAQETKNSIQKSDKNRDSRDMVSQNELSQLLNF